MSQKAAEIADALLARFATLSIGSPPLPLSMPDLNFNPATDSLDGCYIEANPFLNVPAWEGLEDDVLDQGLFVIGVVWRKGEGLIVPLQKAGLVADHFPKGLMLTSGLTTIKISARPLVSTPLQASDKTTVPVTVSWVA